MAFMVYFNFFGCVLAPLVAMFAMYSYIYSIVRRHIARIAAMMPPQGVAMATRAQQQDSAQLAAAVGQSESSTSHEVPAAVHSSNVEMTVPARQG